MAEATLSSKYQVVIPREIRRQIRVTVGEKMVVLAKDGIINLIPASSLVRLRGFVKGIKTAGLREERDRL